MKSISALTVLSVVVFVGAEKRSDIAVFGGQLESGFLPIVGHHDDQYIKSYSITKKMPFTYPFNFEKKVTLDKPHQVYSSRPHQACSDKKLPQPITVEKHVLVPFKIPIVKPYPIYVEKKVPYQVEKKIPYFVYRPYPLHAEKPLAYHLREENQLTYPAEKPSPQAPHQADGASASSYQFKVPQGLYAEEGQKAQQASLQEGYDGSEFFFSDYFSKSLQQEPSAGNFADQIGKQLASRELSNTNKQTYI